MFNTSSSPNPTLTTVATITDNYSTGVIVIITIAMTLLSIIIVTSNILVIFVYAKNTNLQVPKNYFILSLAIADVLIGVFSVNFYTVYLVVGHWPLGEIACDLWLSMDYSCCQASTLSLLAISIDRYLCIRCPVFYRNKLTKTNLKRIIISLWILAFIVWFGSIFLYPYIYGERTVAKGMCHVQFLYENPPVTLTTAFINFYGPIIIMTIIYICISVTLVRRYKNKYGNVKVKTHVHTSSPSNSYYPESKSVSIPMVEAYKENGDKIYIEQDQSRNNNAKVIYKSANEDVQLVIKTQTIRTTEATISSKTLPLNIQDSPLPTPRLVKRSTKRQKQYNAHKRAVTLLLLVIIAFAITWFPYHLLAVIAPFCGTCIVTSWWHFAYIFCYVNSLLNPLCYAFGNRHFKKCFQDIFLGCKKKLTLFKK